MLRKNSKVRKNPAKELARRENNMKVRAAILQAIIFAAENPHEIIDIIVNLPELFEAKKEIMRRYDFDEFQAQAIIDTRIRGFSPIEIEKMKNEIEEVKNEIERIKQVKLLI